MRFGQKACIYYAAIAKIAARRVFAAHGDLANEERQNHLQNLMHKNIIDSEILLRANLLGWFLVCCE